MSELHQRRLLIVPIIHSPRELGSLAKEVHQSKVASVGRERAALIAQTVAGYWEELSKILQSLELPYADLLIYQDGLPVVENEALGLERRIVADLARGGSLNHHLVQWLLDRGACLVGTESPALLLQEYQAIKEKLSRGFTSGTVQGDEPQDGVSIEQALDAADSHSLLQQRDRFIAQRIDATLGRSQLGLLFIGMLHQVELHLNEDITVDYPIGRPVNSAARLLDQT